MPDLTAAQQLFEQVQHLPSIETPAALVGSLAVASGAAAMTWRRHGQSSEAFAVHSTNPALLEETIVAVGGNVVDANRATRPRRLAGGLMSLIGLGLLVGAYAANPTYETSAADSAANTIVLLDTSSSMDTQDLGQPNVSRLQAAVDGLEATTFNGKLGVVEFAATTKTRVPLTEQKDLDMPDLTKRSVDPNGGKLAEALQDSIDLLPGQVKKDKSISRNGTVTVITDGTVESTKQEIKELVADNDVDIRVIVTGTPEGTYNQAGQTVNSGIQPELFGSLGDNVTIAATAEDVSDAIQETIKDSSTTKQEQDWQILDGIGVLMLAAGIARVNWQMATKKV